MPDKENKEVPNDPNILRHSQHPPIRTSRKPENSIIQPIIEKKKPPQNKKKEEK